MTKTEKQYLGSAKNGPLGVQVLSTLWLSGYDTDPPTLELRLSNGGYVKIGWDMTYSHRLLWWAPDRQADFVTATPAMTGLDPDVFGPLVDEVAQAAESHARQMEETDPPKFSHADRMYGGGL